MDGVRIIINIGNRYDVYRTIVETIPYMNGWTLDSNAKEGNHHWGVACPSFFAFDLTNKNFCWLVPDDCPSEDALDSMAVTDVATASHLLEFVNDFGDTFSCDNIKTDPEDLAKLFEAFFKDGTEPKDKAQAELARYVEKLKKDAESAPQSGSFGSYMESDLIKQLVQIQPMTVPSGPMFYMDYVYGPVMNEGKTNVEAEIAKKMAKKMAAIYAKKELDPSLYGTITINTEPKSELTTEKIYSMGHSEVYNALKKLEGLHDSHSEYLKSHLKKRLQELQSAGGKSLPYEATTKIKLHSLKSNWKPTTEKKLKWPTPEEMEKISVSMANTIGVEMENEILNQMYGMVAIPKKLTTKWDTEYQGHWTSPDEAKEKQKDKDDALKLAFSNMAYLMPKDK